MIAVLFFFGKRYFTFWCQSTYISIHHIYLAKYKDKNTWKWIWMWIAPRPCRLAAPAPHHCRAAGTLHMRLVLKLLRRRREILRFEIAELLLSVMGELSNSNLFKLCRYSLSPVFRKQLVFVCEVVWIKRTCQPLSPRPGRPSSRHNR